MAEPTDSPENTQGDTGPTAPEPESPSLSDIIKLTSGDLFPAGKMNATDDTPTVISRSPLATIRSEEAFANILRGRRLAHFELLGSLGVGGMAAVIRARDTQLDRTVALKILPPDMASDPEIVRRFHQEARAAAKLDHENIARVFFCGEDQGLHFIAFELVEGDNLKTLLEERGKIPVPEAIGYMLQIATGLAHAATRGVVHRDIKPSNIIISANGRAKLVDMGLARSLDPNADGGLTQSGVTLGTFDYISPEQALEPRDADVRSDIYSLGCTFYHMLTGHPPVPEGTAAKKLHHHQNINPLDPRQLNPQIPDDVASLLSRMMAKDPRDRYQRPEQLVQHLIVLAQRLGAVHEVPDAVLFVDAPLLGPQRTRPLLIAGLAGFILVVLVVMLAPPSGLPVQRVVEPRTASTKSDQASDKGSHSDFPVTPGSARGNDLPKSTTKVEPYYAKDVKELAEYLSKTPDAHVYVTRDLTFTPEDQLVFQGHSLILESLPGKDGSRVRAQRALSLSYDSRPQGSDWTILRIMAGNVTIRNLRFELDALGAEIPMTGIDWQGGTLLVESSAFYQSGTKDTRREERVSSLVINGPPTLDERTPVELRYCYFAGGKDALFLASPGKVHASHCAFGPQDNALVEMGMRFNSDNTSRRGIWLTNCSAFVGRSVFQIADGVRYTIQADNCVFSRPEGSPIGSGMGTLIEEKGNSAAESLFSASGNYYHNLDTFWARSSSLEVADSAATLDLFKQRFPLQVKDDRSIELSATPWSEPQPLKKLEEARPEQAFVLHTDRIVLRQIRDRQQMIGTHRCAWAELYPTLPDLEKKPRDVLAQNQKRIVDPNAESRGTTYKKLSQAVEDAQPGDVILIRYTGLLREDPVQIKDANANLTIRPYDNSHPILAIGQSPDQDAALVRVHDGRVTFENMEFRLAPDKAGYRAQSVAMVMGDGQCSFTNCVVTLEPREGTSLSMITLSDPSAVMKMMPQPTQQEDPRIVLSGCFVRGTGQVVTVRVSRPFELKAEDSLLALNGSMLVIDANSKETSASRSAGITLSHVTTYLTDHLISLRAAKESGTKGLVTTQIKSASDCLFAGAAGKALIHLEGIDMPEGQMQRYVSWSDSQRNTYSNYTQFLEQQPASDAMPQPPLTANAWRDFTGDPDSSRFERVRFSAPPPADASLSRVAPTDFRLRGEPPLQGCGANIDRLPTLFREPETEKSSEDSP